MVDGVITTSDLDPYDPQKGSRLRFILKAYKDKRDLEWTKFQQQYLAQMLSAQSVSAESLKGLLKMQSVLYDDVRYSLLFIKPESEEESTRRYAGAWETTFGNLSDPEVQENVERVTAALKAMDKSK